MPEKFKLNDEQSLIESNFEMVPFVNSLARERGLKIEIVDDPDDCLTTHERVMTALMEIASAKPTGPAAQAKPSAAKASTDVIEPTLTEKALAARKGTTAKPQPVDTRSLSERCRAAR